MSTMEMLDWRCSHPRMTQLDIETLVASNDRLLEPLIRAAGPSAEQEIERILVSYAQPLTERIVRWWDGPSSNGLLRDHVDDISSTVNLRLIDKLRRVAHSADEAVHNLDKYLATLTLNVIHDHLRKQFPERTRLRQRLRYMLGSDRRLALWSDAGSLACGLREWRETKVSCAAIAIPPEQITAAMRGQDADAVAAILRAVGQPVPFDALIDWTAGLWQIVENVPSEIDADAAPSVEPTPLARLESRQFLESLWREIRELRPMQRKALLLNLRDETVNAISLLVVSGVAPFDDVAAALEMTPEALAAIWYDLPFDDQKIAAMLSVTRQQVINLRKAARARLLRKTSGVTSR